MLSGTLITAAGFLPIATAKSTTGEYTFAIFAVVTVIALLISWFAAVTGDAVHRQPASSRSIAAAAGRTTCSTRRFYRRLRGLDRLVHRAPQDGRSPDDRAVRARRWSAWASPRSSSSRRRTAPS